MRIRPSIVPLAVAAILAAGCARKEIAGVQPPINPKAMAFYNEGKQLFLGVDVRPYALTPKAEALVPLQIAICDKGVDNLEISREGILLEGADGKTLPLATYQEYLKSYGRARMDVKAGQPFRETLQGRFAEAPYTHRDLEFYPPRNAAQTPRAFIVLRRGEVAEGFIFFRLSELPPAAGRYKLLLKAKGLDTFVVEFPAQ